MKREQAPEMLVHATAADGGEDARIIRVNLLYEPKGCCSNSGSGLADEPPEVLFINGFRRDSFEEWIGRLKAIRKIRRTCLYDFCCFNFLLFVPCFCTCFCALGRKGIAKWDAALREWQDGFNRQILEECGMFVKTQSKCDATYVNDADGRKKIRSTKRWLAFALTPEDVAKLKREPHLMGDIDENSCGINENELCMHP